MISISYQDIEVFDWLNDWPSKVPVKGRREWVELQGIDGIVSLDLKGAAGLLVGLVVGVEGVAGWRRTMEMLEG